MSAKPASSSKEVRILILDDDKDGQSALAQVLDSEGWQVRVAPLAADALAELARGEDYAMIIANVAITGLEGPHFTTLKELSQALAVEDDKRRVRVLFLVPELVALQAQPVLEQERLPYTLKPLNLHDFLEKVSDLLLERAVISAPIRRVKREHGGSERRQRERRSAARRNKPMFASRDDYSITDEELAEYEAEQLKLEEEAKLKREKQLGKLGQTPPDE